MEDLWKSTKNEIVGYFKKTKDVYNGERVYSDDHRLEIVLNNVNIMVTHHKENDTLTFFIDIDDIKEKFGEEVFENMKKIDNHIGKNKKTLITGFSVNS